MNGVGGGVLFVFSLSIVDENTHFVKMDGCGYAENMRKNRYSTTTTMMKEKNDKKFDVKCSLFDF